MAVLALLIAPVFSLNLGEPQATATAATAPAAAREGLDALASSGIGSGVLRPTEILLTAHSHILLPGTHITIMAPSAWSRGGNSAWSRGGNQVADAWSPADPSTGAGRARSVKSGRW
jgi:putative drug exporter of the RND superfamily